jgi:hypothetical protein
MKEVTEGGVLVRIDAVGGLFGGDHLVLRVLYTRIGAEFSAAEDPTRPLCILCSREATRSRNIDH